MRLRLISYDDINDYVCFSGDKFDVREFNNEVLQAGRVPLKLLENSIEKWIVHVVSMATVTTIHTSTLVTLTLFTVLNNIYVS